MRERGKLIGQGAPSLQEILAILFVVHGADTPL
jgi:hypothetical protein